MYCNENITVKLVVKELFLKAYTKSSLYIFFLNTEIGNVHNILDVI